MPRIYKVISKTATDFPEWMPNVTVDGRAWAGEARRRGSGRTAG